MDTIGDPIRIGYFAGGLDSPTFKTRRQIVITAYVQLESVQLFAENEDAAARFGEQLGRVLHAQLGEAS